MDNFQQSCMKKIINKGTELREWMKLLWYIKYDKTIADLDKEHPQCLEGTAATFTLPIQHGIKGDPAQYILTRNCPSSEKGKEKAGREYRGQTSAISPSETCHSTTRVHPLLSRRIPSASTVARVSSACSNPKVKIYWLQFQLLRYEKIKGLAQNRTKLEELYAILRPVSTSFQHCKLHVRCLSHLSSSPVHSYL